MSDEIGDYLKDRRPLGTGVVFFQLSIEDARELLLLATTGVQYFGAPKGTSRHYQHSSILECIRRKVDTDERNKEPT